MKRNYKKGHEYFWEDKSLGGFSKVIGKIIVDDPTREIIGFSIPVEETDCSYKSDSFIVDLKDIYKYRHFISTFSIGYREDEPTIFWIHLV